MNSLYIVLCIVAAVSSASVVDPAEQRNAPAGGYGAAVEQPQYYDYAAPQGYAPAKPNVIQEIKSSLGALLTIDTVILGLAIAGGLLLLQAIGLINLAPIVGALQALFPPITIAGARNSKESPMARAVDAILGSEVDRVSEIVHNAIDNIERWNSL